MPEISRHQHIEDSRTYTLIPEVDETYLDNFNDSNCYASEVTAAGDSVFRGPLEGQCSPEKIFAHIFAFAKLYNLFAFCFCWAHFFCLILLLLISEKVKNGKKKILLGNTARRHRHLWHSALFQRHGWRLPLWHLPSICGLR